MLTEETKHDFQTAMDHLNTAMNTLEDIDEAEEAGHLIYEAYEMLKKLIA